MNSRHSLAAFVALVLGGGFLLGLLTTPGEWYAGLAKPAFNPPPWLFAPVWTVLYVMIAVAGWRTWQRDRSSLAMTFWWVQLGLNFLWTPVFFTAHMVGLALAIILLLLAAIIGFMAASWRQDRATAWLFLPYAAWVAFATLLNGSIYTLN